jgi:hypothetical protein
MTDPDILPVGSSAQRADAEVVVTIGGAKIDSFL